MFCKLCHVRGSSFQCIALKRLRGRTLRVSHHVRDDDPEAHRQEERDLVAPPEAEVWPPMNKKYRGPGRMWGISKEVMICFAIKYGVVVLDPGVLGRKFVGGHCVVF